MTKGMDSLKYLFVLSLFFIMANTVSAGGVLMTFPKDGQEFLVDSRKDTFIFEWESAGPDKEYLIEIFGNKNSPAPSYSRKVKGTRFEFMYKKIPRRFYWRVTALSEEKVQTPVDAFAVNVKWKSEVPLRYQLQPSLLFSTTNFRQDFEGNAEIQETADFSGPALNVAGEYFLKRNHFLRSLSFEARYGRYQKSSDFLTDTRFLIEYGWLSNPFGNETHNFHLGYLLHTINFEFGENISAAYAMNFISGRYSWIRIWSRKTLFEITASLMLTVPPKNFTPSFLIKPVYHHRLSGNWWAIALAMYERYSATGLVKASGEEADMTIDVQNFSIGIGISYRPE